MSDIEVSIIGCGPAAMMIAHACDQHGVNFRLYGPGTPSFISGAQYLHSDVGVRYDGLRPETVRYRRIGTEAGYEAKIYGKLPENMQTSWSKFKEEVEAWPLIGIYQFLFSKFYDKISRIEVTLEQVLELGERTLTFNTAPLPALMPDATYEVERVAILNGHSTAPPMTIVYNGDPEEPWYRMSNLWSSQSIEYPHDFATDAFLTEDPNVTVVKKPLRTDAFIPNVILSGRYGRWEKGVLVDESYYQAIEAIRNAAP
jgi:hypothetical protein